MKILFRISFIILLLGFTSVLPAQNKFGAFGEASFKYTSLSNQNTLILGGRFGLVINESIVVGGGFYGNINGIHTGFIDKLSGQTVMLNMNYGGLELEYILLPHSPIHASVGILLAGGGLYFGVSDKSVPHNSYSKLDLLVYEPSVNIEFNSISWLHVDLNMSYRIITSYNHAVYGISNDDLEGLSVGLIFKFGSY
ncbi:MAG: hypothetical protein WAM24_06980 [Ignavibacteriaceae bacterium]